METNTSSTSHNNIAPSTCHIQYLPRELILEIIKYLNSSDTISLVVSARLFNDAWNDDYISICLSLLRQEATLYTEEALGLIKSQSGSSGYSTPKQASLLLRNFSRASFMLSQFNLSVRLNRSLPSMKPIENFRFIRNLYRVWTFCTTGDESYLQSFGYLELERMVEIAQWYVGWEAERCNGKESHQWWLWLKKIVKARDNVPVSLGSRFGEGVRRPSWAYGPKWTWAFFDDYCEFWQGMQSTMCEPCRLVELESVDKKGHTSHCGECRNLLLN
ncbi:Protein of unknown function [Pyronema omphalodes CBS 100304]|uniref:F-box domain-containing protein n=1 Tax=Pyronema omphalodes (strain CBS 100304) TaxID=1076935 RepID=U4LE74_PYROM|nr:Protein of unknown function [Pyronema omphalodes CBS 100304]